MSCLMYLLEQETARHVLLSTYKIYISSRQIIKQYFIGDIKLNVLTHPKFCLMQICFATCFDQNVLRNLKSKEGREISIHINSTGLVIR